MKINQLKRKILLVLVIIALICVNNISFSMETSRVSDISFANVFTSNKNEPSILTKWFWRGVRHTGAAACFLVGYDQCKSGNYKTATALFLGGISCLSLGDFGVKCFHAPTYKRNENFKNLLDAKATFFDSESNTVASYSERAFLPQYVIGPDPIKIGVDEFHNIYDSVVHNNSGLTFSEQRKVHFYNYFKNNCIPIGLTFFCWMLEKIQTTRAKTHCILNDTIAQELDARGISSHLDNIDEKVIIQWCAQYPGIKRENWHFLKRYILGYNCDYRFQKSNTQYILKKKNIKEHWIEKLPSEIWCRICTFISEKKPVVWKMPKIKLSLEVLEESSRIREEKKCMKKQRAILNLWLKERKIVLTPDQFIYMLQYCYFKSGSKSKEILNPWNIENPYKITNIGPIIEELSAKIPKILDPWAYKWI